MVPPPLPGWEGERRGSERRSAAALPSPDRRRPHRATVSAEGGSREEGRLSEEDGVEAGESSSVCVLGNHGNVSLLMPQATE